MSWVLDDHGEQQNGGKSLFGLKVSCRKSKHLLCVVLALLCIHGTFVFAKNSTVCSLCCVEILLLYTERITPIHFIVLSAWCTCCLMSPWAAEPIQIREAFIVWILKILLKFSFQYHHAPPCRFPHVCFLAWMPKLNLSVWNLVCFILVFLQSSAADNLHYFVGIPLLCIWSKTCV